MSETLPLITDIPLPKRARTNLRPRARKYPIDKMEVGQMFFIPRRTKNTSHTYFSSAGKKLGIRLASRLVHMVHTDEGWQLCEPDDPDAVPGVGVWRVA